MRRLVGTPLKLVRTVHIYYLLPNSRFTVKSGKMEERDVLHTHITVEANSLREGKGLAIIKLQKGVRGFKITEMIAEYWVKDRILL